MATTRPAPARQGMVSLRHRHNRLRCRWDRPTAADSAGWVCRNASPLPAAPTAPMPNSLPSIVKPAHVSSWSPRVASLLPKKGPLKRQPTLALGSSGADADAAVPLRLRPGAPSDQQTIAGAILKERMNPLGLSMQRFVVAEDPTSGCLLGFGQLKEWPTLSKKDDARGQLVRALNLYPNWKGDLVELSSLIVLEEHRGKGVGSAIVSELVRRAEGKNLCLLTIGATVPFYQRLGFKEISSEAVPHPLKPEVFFGTIVARLAVGDRLVCMAHSSTLERGMLSPP